MDNDVGDPIEVLANQEARSCREIVGVLYRHLWIDLKVEFDMVLQACLAGEDLLHAQHTFRTQCRVPNSLIHDRYLSRDGGVVLARVSEGTDGVVLARVPTGGVC